MFQGWAVIAVALAYLGLLFAIASYGDRIAQKRKFEVGRPVLYALTLGVYCTSWTFFGSVGLASKSGLDFLPVYIGPILMIGLGWPLVRRIVELSKRQNITSIADFIAARYGKSQAVAAIVAIIAVIGALPYIALQLKAVSTSLATMISGVEPAIAEAMPLPVIGDLALLVALAMATFSVLFGTRHIDATEHQDGLMLAIAAESVVKLVAFLLVGGFVTFVMFGGIDNLFAQASAREDIVQLFTRDFDGGRWITITLLSTVAILLLPRQFHVAVVENKHPSDIKRAAWLFPLYLIAINLFVVPIAVAGLLTFSPGTVDGDTFVLALPLSAGQSAITLVAFIGGLSAATAMVIVATIALSIMVCNDLVVPLILRKSEQTGDDPHEDMGKLLLNIRRTAIFAILILAYVYDWMVTGQVALASIGLLSFAAIAQLAPALFGGLIWRRATARGAIAGILTGFAVWTYTLLMPSFIRAGWMPADLLQSGPFGIALLRPEMLFNLEFDPLTHGVLWSLLANIAAYVSVSLLTRPQPIERLQAQVFVSAELPVAAPGFRLWRTAVSVGDLKKTVARYLGEERTERSFEQFASTRNVILRNDGEADVRLLRHAEHLLASAVGAASSRLVLALLLERHNLNRRGAIKLLDDASAAIQYNRDLLQSAIDHVRQGIAVFDRELRLICWNRQFRHLLEVPAELGRVGVPLQEIIRHIGEHGSAAGADVEAIISDRVEKIVMNIGHSDDAPVDGHTVLEVRSNAMPDGGVVVTFADITDRVEAAEALERANETLERRVQERTAELVEVNSALATAKAEADAANIGKTRFLAAASHDILQPLNAARLYATSLVERAGPGEERTLIENVDASLEAVEDILGVLLDISRLDAGALKPDISTFQLDEFFDALTRDFEPIAKERQLRLKVVSSSLAVRSDRRLLRRVLQNFLSNAIKYTDQGTVLIGVRRAGDTVRIEVHDTGPGIAETEREAIFEEFRRLDNKNGTAPGLGLGLSIVQRIGQVLGHDIQVDSRPGRGSVFAVEVPVAASPAIAIAPPRRRSTAATDLDGVVICCIDNEPNILKGMEALMSGWGCRVIGGIDADAAVAVLEKEGAVPDIVLADYHLDRDDGVAAVGRLRERFGPDLPAIMITADRSRALREKIADRDIRILNKPVKPAALRAMLARHRFARQAAE